MKGESLNSKVMIVFMMFISRNGTSWVLPIIWMIVLWIVLSLSIVDWGPDCCTARHLGDAASLAFTYLIDIRTPSTELASSVSAWILTIFRTLALLLIALLVLSVRNTVRR